MDLTHSSSLIVEILTRQLEFLQQELKSKDEIIIMLLNERKHPLHNNFDNRIPFQSNKSINQVKEHHIHQNVRQVDDKYINTNNINNDSENTSFNNISPVINEENNNRDFETVTSKNKRKKGNIRTIAVLGDSMIKDLNA